jgi:hypothetical protein
LQPEKCVSACDITDYQEQFLTYSVQNLGYPYDKKSLMHYKNTEFTANGQRTIQSLANPDELLGNDEFFTTTDVKQINALYNCPSRFLKCKFHCLLILDDARNRLYRLFAFHPMASFSCWVFTCISCTIGLKI